MHCYLAAAKVSDGSGLHSTSEDPTGACNEKQTGRRYSENYFSYSFEIKLISKYTYIAEVTWDSANKSQVQHIFEVANFSVY